MALIARRKTTNAFKTFIAKLINVEVCLEVISEMDAGAVNTVVKITSIDEDYNILCACNDYTLEAISDSF